MLHRGSLLPPCGGSISHWRCHRNPQSWGCYCGRHVHLCLSDMLALNITKMLRGNAVPTKVRGSVLLRLCLRGQDSPTTVVRFFHLCMTSSGLRKSSQFMSSSKRKLFVKKKMREGIKEVVMSHTFVWKQRLSTSSFGLISSLEVLFH